jgi:hypothetical protein
MCRFLHNYPLKESFFHLLFNKIFLLLSDILITHTCSHARNLRKTFHINNLCNNPIPINIWKRYKHCVGIAVRGLWLLPLQAPERQAHRLHPLAEAIPCLCGEKREDSLKAANIINVVLKKISF